MNMGDIRSRYLEFFRKRGHSIIPSASLVPHNDPTTLFTGSGMQPLIQNLLGTPHPLGSRLANSQKCFRAEDIAEVGDNRHTTFFEMLGNWSLGDYFKKEQLSWIFDFLTGDIGLDPTKLYVTVFIGDDKHSIPRDIESASIWRKLFTSRGIDAKEVELGSKEDGARLGMQGGRIFYYDVSKNWWSRAGVPERMPPGEPGGPDSEIFYDFGITHDSAHGRECHPNCDCGRFLEIGNSVFMQYIKREDGSFGLLPKQNVDFGGGLERIAAAANNNADIFLTDVFRNIIGLLEQHTRKMYSDSRYQKSFRIVADHIRGATWMVAEGIRPSNTDRGYILRRLIRRAEQHLSILGAPAERAEDSMLVRSAIVVIEAYKRAYPELEGERVYETIKREIWEEEKRFAHALERGLREFDRVSKDGYVSAKDALALFATHGLPFEMIVELAKERGIDVDEEGFRREMEEHQRRSRAGIGQKFRGGLADTSEKTTRLHTTHHLLLKALQIVLGSHVKQRGSNITQERLRIDFSHGQKLTEEQRAEVERIVNEKIREELPVIRSVMSKQDAEKLGAEQEFGARYPDIVSVYSIGPQEATPDNPQFERAFSIELCGGPHVSNTAYIRESGIFKIQKEEAVASGIRRIKAVLV